MRSWRCAFALLPACAVSACHWILPYPVGGVDGSAPEDGRRDESPVEMLLDSAGTDGLGPREVGPRDVASTDKPRQPDTAMDVKVVKADGKGKTDQTPADGGPCGPWSAWVCPSPTSYYCVATCGAKVIVCGTTSCTCTVGGSNYGCSGALPGYCGSCQNALASGCCAH